MSRNINKFYPSQQFRKTGSPNLMRLANPTDKQRNQEYRSNERESQPQKPKDSDSLSKQKNTSNQTASARSNNQKGQNVQQVKETRNSKSKERKDYMAVNLTRFNRKKEDVRSPSNTSQRSNSNQPKEEKKQRYIYTFKDQIKAKEHVKSEYSALPSSISSKTSRAEKSSRAEEKLSQPEESKSRVEERYEVSEIRSNNTSIAMSSRGKPLQVNVVKYEDRKESVRQVQREERQKQQVPSIMHTSSQLVVSEPQSQKRLPISETMRVQMQLSHQRQFKYSEELMAKLKNQREEFSSRLRAIEREKLSLQQANTHLLQEKYQIQAQLTIMANSNAELQRELSNARDSAVRTNRQSQRTNKNNELMFKELEGRYNSLLQEYRNATKRNSEMAMEVSQAEAKIEDLKNAVRSAGEQAKNRFLEMEKVRRIADARMGELQLEHQFQLKQLQMRTSDKNKRDLQLEETVRQLERKLQAKTNELQARQQELERLSSQLRDMQELQGLFKSKCAENFNLTAQLNKSKEIIMKISNENNELIRAAAQSAKEKDKEIKKLTQSLSQVRSNNTMQRLATEAQQQLYGGSQETDSFQDLIKGQSEETNRLRSDIADKQEQIFRVRGDNDELRERVRKLQQQSQMNARTYTMNLNNLKEVKQATEMMLKKRIAALEAARLH